MINFKFGLHDSLRFGFGRPGKVITKPAFRTIWKTDNTGVSSSTQIQLPLHSTGTYNFLVDWGDGSSDTITAWDQAETLHTYSVAGTYNVKITGTITGFVFNGGGDRLKLLSIAEWDGFGLGSQPGMFKGCSNLTCTATDSPVLGTTMREAFMDCTNFNCNVKTWDTTGVGEMTRAFNNCVEFDSDLGQWDASGFTLLFSTFRGCTKFKGTGLENWTTTSLTSLFETFRDCPAFNGDVSGFDVSSVSVFNSCFQNAVVFNQDLSSWNTSSATNIGVMFDGAVSFDQDIGSWDVTGVTNMLLMFQGVTLSTSNYNALLVGWESQVVQNNVTFHGGNSKYSAGAPATARANLIADHTWTITDGGQE